jgi:curved DNA-binding protein CbpA
VTGLRRRVRRPPDPFAALGLPARPELTDDDVRAAWRRVAAATHPDRSDGGDPARFADAAAAYTELRTPFGRGEAMADARAGQRRIRLRRGAQSGQRTVSPRVRIGRGGAMADARAGQRRTRFSRAASLLPARIRHGRPGRLAFRVLAAGAASAAAVAAAGAQPATPALVTGALTWLLLTARQDLAPPPDHPNLTRSHRLRRP